MASLDNPRFPHKVEILRVEYDEYGESVKDENGDEILKVVFESECGFRDLVRAVDVDVKVIKSDYKVSLPKHSFQINPLDTIIVYHAYTDEVIIGDVEISKVCNLGANIWFQRNYNKHG